MKVRGMSTAIVAPRAVPAPSSAAVPGAQSPVQSAGSNGVGAGADGASGSADPASLPLTDHHLTAHERTNLAVVLRAYPVAEGAILDVDAFIDQFAEGGVLNDLVAGESYRGKAMGDLLNKMVRVFPDVHRELKSITVNGDTISIELSVQGTFDGPMPTPHAELAPNGAKVDVPTADFWQLRDGKVEQFNCYLGYSSMFAQLGASPA